jgi:hypothetical protein
MNGNRLLAAMLLVGAAVTMTACGHTREALGLTKVTPDEFRVVTKAPLVLPPDYDLRPPAPGEPRPQELQPDSAARQALLGERIKENRSQGEKILVARAGGDKADPLARFVVDDDQGIAYKDKSFADRVMFWKKNAKEGAVANNTAEGPGDPKIEALRIKELTADKKVIIAKQEPKKKLPGL